MRFAIETDCDQRVLHAAGDPQTYAQVLLRVAEQRMTSRLAILMSAPSSLERRIGILLRPPRRLGMVAAVCVPFGLAALLAAAQIPAPSLRSPDMKPRADQAHAIAASVPTEPGKTRNSANVVALGLVTATTVNVTARVDGQLASVAFQEGRPVKVGQLLASIESPQLQAQFDRATNQLSEDRKVRAEATIPADEAAVAEAKRLLAYTQVRAPISGVAGFRKVDAGNFVHAGDTLLVITQRDPIAVVASISEDDLPRVHMLLGSGATPVVEAWNRGNTERLATGRLTAVDNAIDPATGTIKLKALFDNTDGALFPNQFVNVRLLLRAR
jgi:multidrug efflux system membrane fusion protein